MFDIIIVQIDSNISSMLLSLIIIFPFELGQKVVYFVSSSFSIFLNSKTNIVKNLNSVNLDNKFISLFLITDSVSLSYSSGLKEFKVSALKEIA